MPPVCSWSLVTEDAVSLEAARRLLGAVPPPVSRYAVTHAIDYEDLSRIVEDLPIDTLQIHDHVERAVVEKLRSDYPEMRFVKALHVTDSGVGSYQEWEVSRPATWRKRSRSPARTSLT
jgi:phosphoribosylanthranilate isomerase